MCNKEGKTWCETCGVECRGNKCVGCLKYEEDRRREWEQIDADYQRDLEYYGGSHDLLDDFLDALEQEEDLQIELMMDDLFSHDFIL